MDNSKLVYDISCIEIGSNAVIYCNLDKIKNLLMKVIPFTIFIFCPWI